MFLIKSVKRKNRRNTKMFAATRYNWSYPYLWTHYQAFPPFQKPSPQLSHWDYLYLPLYLAKQENPFPGKTWLHITARRCCEREAFSCRNRLGALFDQDSTWWIDRRLDTGAFFRWYCKRCRSGRRRAAMFWWYHGVDQCRRASCRLNRIQDWRIWESVRYISGAIVMLGL